MEENSSEGEAETMEAVVEGSSDPGPLDENARDSDEEEQFDITLAAHHSYMGPGMSTVSGRRLLEAGWRGRVPVWAHHGVVFPGETVPVLRVEVNHAPDAEALRAIHKEQLFGLLCPDETGTAVSGYGVLCEVYEAATAAVGEGAGDGAAPLTRTFKARATHRFRLADMPAAPVPLHLYQRTRFAEVVVLREYASPLRPPRLASLDSLRQGCPKRDRRLRALDEALTPWPRFLYDMFDYDRMRGYIADYFLQFNLSALPRGAGALSLWAAAHLPLRARERLALLAADDALLRLHMEVRLIARRSGLSCTLCKTQIARREHIIAMSSEGVHSNYTNLGGYMHDIMTVSSADSVRLDGAASAEYSWFPGYTWTIALCAVCTQHVGWRFDAQKRSLRPQQFFGLCRNAVAPRADSDDDDDDDQL